jgi:uncharacterized protein (DUF2147 family)
VITIVIARTIDRALIQHAKLSHANILGFSMKRIPLAPLAALAITLSAAPALAADPTGMWLTEDGEAKIKVASCGSAMCGTIAWLKEPNDKTTNKPKTDKNNADASLRNRPVLGSPVLLSMKADGNDKWSGQLYNAEDGKTYSGNIALAGNTLKVQGCVAIICKTKNWTRTN